jgi:hypothetical protein
MGNGKMIMAALGLASAFLALALCGLFLLVI